jgi:two-component system, OmpR family, phosphate regulon sensor histidine kinase PhoR
MTNEIDFESPAILVVDDEKGIRDGCERILGRMGCQVHLADCGEAGLKLLKRESITVALIDLKMPGMDGIELLKHIQAHDPQILTIIITGYATLETAVDAMKKGAYDFIPKPFAPDQLRIGVKRALEKRRLTLEAAKNLADLDREKSRIRTIVETLPNGVVVTDPTGRVVLMNPAFLNHLGLAPDLTPGKQIDAYIVDEGFCGLIFELSKGQPSASDTPPTYEFSAISEKYLLARGRSVLDDENTCQGAVVILVDITAVKVLDRLKSEFVAKVSHELRSPLATVHEQLSQVLKDLVGDQYKDDQHILTRAKEKTGGLISLIGDLLDLSRIESGVVCPECQPVLIPELLQDIVVFLQAQTMAKKQRLEFEKTVETFPPFMADPLALESIFGNLISNAIRYSPEGAKIMVTAAMNGEQFEIAVKDNGYGIDSTYLDKIFDKFYRVKTPRTRYITGTGLGLSIVKGLLDGLGGDICVESKPNVGSTFTVFLPIENPAV